MITTIVIIVIWVGAVAISTIPFWFDSDMRIAVLGVILVVGIIVTMLYSSRILYCGIELIKINRGRDKYELVETTIAASYLSRMYFTRYAKVLKCSAHLTKDNVTVDFNVYIDMYDNDIELKAKALFYLCIMNPMEERYLFQKNNCVPNGRRKGCLEIHFTKCINDFKNFVNKY